MSVAKRLGMIMNRAIAASSYRIHIATANTWRDQYNPLRSLTISRAVNLLEEGGSGTLAGAAHADTFLEIAQAEAAEISEILRRFLDREILAKATPGEAAYAYFELAANQGTDTGEVIKNVVALKGAGFDIPAAWVTEKTGIQIAQAAVAEPVKTAEKKPPALPAPVVEPVEPIAPVQTVREGFAS